MLQSFAPRPTPVTKEYQPRHIRSPTDHDIRSPENRGRNEKQQGPGIDNLTSDIMMLGGDEPLEQITRMCKKKIETKNKLVEWKEVKMIILHKIGGTKKN